MMKHHQVQGPEESSCQRWALHSTLDASRRWPIPGIHRDAGNCRVMATKLPPGLPENPLILRAAQVLAMQGFLRKQNMNSSRCNFMQFCCSRF